MIPIVNQATQYLSSIAVISDGNEYSYKELIDAAHHLAYILLENQRDLNNTRVAFMVHPGFDYVKTQWAIWMAGGVAVPLCITYPAASLLYVIEDTQASIVISTSAFDQILSPIIEAKDIKWIDLDMETISSYSRTMPSISLSRPAMILYTSGTTSLPKGVVTSHEGLVAQITSLTLAWNWSSQDHILCVLPLHHVHGIINVVCCALWSGAVCQFLPRFSEEQIFNAFLDRKINLFMAVPTIYFKLIQYWEKLNKLEKERIFDILKSFRLMVSGSAALPVSTMEKWEKISNHILLERYGMTEIGMAISNPYDGIRLSGHVGLPLPGVKVRLADEKDDEIREEAGEIQVKGLTVFKEYWQRPEDTRKAFTADGWFKTGDIAIIDNNSYKILGRNSTDIIKSGGYKISALEIEEILRTHSNIEDCSVIGLPDDEWGELIAAALVLKSSSLTSQEINGWLREKLPSYKIPRKFILMQDLPRNAMGKVTKNDIKKLFIK